jgi:hypothetical protein
MKEMNLLLSKVGNFRLMAFFGISFFCRWGNDPLSFDWELASPALLSAEFFQSLQHTKSVCLLSDIVSMDFALVKQVLF